MWLPPVRTSMPAANNPPAESRVRPKPPAAFSPLHTTRSRAWRRLSSGRSACTTSRPGAPMTSAMKRMLSTVLGPAGLLGVVHGRRLADHGHADLSRVLQLLLDAPGDLARQVVRPGVVHPRVLDHDADLAAGLDGVGLLDPREGGGDALQGLQALDVDLEALAPPAGPRPRYGIGRRDQHRPQAPTRVVVVMVADALQHRLGLAVARRHLHAQRRVRALLVVVDGLADVVQQAAALGHLLVHADLGRHHARQVGDLDRVAQDVLPVRGAVVEPAQQLLHLGVDAVPADLDASPLAHLADARLDLALDLGDDLLDA